MNQKIRLVAPEAPSVHMAKVAVPRELKCDSIRIRDNS